MDIDRDIARIADQERRLRFARFGRDAAWQLGTHLREMALARDLPLVIEVRLAQETIFHCAMADTAPANADWARRKRNTVELLHRSSYAVGLSSQRDGRPTEALMGLPARDFASHGGGFPIHVESVGCIGAVTVSGAPQRVDHALVVEALAALCGSSLEDLALDDG